MKTIFRSWALYIDTGKTDLEFFEYAYPVMVKLTKILQAGILPGDHFPTDYPGQSSTYDVIEVVGHGIYNSGLWLLTQEIMIEATREAIRLGLPGVDSAFVEALESELPVAKNEFETLFWDAVTSHYKIDPTGYSHGNGYFLDFAYGQHIATTLGLPPVMDDQHLATHMLNAYPQFMQLRDETGHFIGPPNIAPVVGPIVPFATFYARPEDDLVWTGSAMTAAATYISEGKRLGNDTLVGMGLEIAHTIEYQMIERFDRGYMFNFPEYWPNIDSTTYAYSGGNRFRVGLDVLNSLHPLRAVVLQKPATSITAMAEILDLRPTAVHLRMNAVLNATAPTQPLAGKTLTFSTPKGALLCTAVSDATGTAACGNPVTFLRTTINLGYVATFAGDDTYSGSSDTGQLIQ